jgi:hypothetical protein
MKRPNILVIHASDLSHRPEIVASYAAKASEASPPSDRAPAGETGAYRKG